MCMKVGIHHRFPTATGSPRFRWQPSDIFALLTLRQSSELSVLLPRRQPKEILILLPLIVNYLFLQSLKAIFERRIQRFRQPLQSADSLWGLPLRQRRPPHPVGFGPWPWSQKINPRHTVGGIYRGPSRFNFFLSTWGQLIKRCPPLPQSQQTGARLLATAVGSLAGCLAIGCCLRRLISVSSSRTRLVVRPVSSAAVVASTCCTFIPG